MSDPIQSYQWTGLDKQGKRAKGFIEAPDIKAAESELKNTGISVITLLPKKSSSFSFSFRRKKIKTKEIVLFTRYLSSMLAAGMPILKSLDIIARDQQNPEMKLVVNLIRTSISSGTTFSDALSQHPKYFDPLYCNLVSAGEKSATLEKVLTRISKYLEKIETLKRKIRNAMIYPIAIVGVATVVSLILLIFVIPQFQTMFQSAGVPLPYFTQLIIKLSDAIRSYWWLILILLGGGIFGFRYLIKHNERVADWVDSLRLKTFVIGTILKKEIIARFTRTLAITLEAGLPISDSMRAMVLIMGNKTYSKGVQEICDSISNGHGLTTSMEATHLFPNMVIQMVSVGEASGKLEDMLSNVANYYEDDVNMIAENISTMLEPIIIIILGIIIGGFVIAMYLPIFKLGSTV